MLQKLQFRPGVNREGTNYSNEGGWFECDKIRFRSGYPEKIGGWTQATPSDSYLGVCRAMVNWIDLNNNNLIGVGTHLKYYINGNLGVYHDITPLRVPKATINADPFATVDGSDIITVTDTGHGAGTGDFVTFSGATGFNGIATATLNAEFQIINVIDSNTYQIILPLGDSATGTGSGGGSAVDAEYQIAIGLPANTTGNGWGAGFWNGANLAPYSTTLTYTSGATPWVLLDAISTTINVGSTASFPASGTIIIDSELISYSGKTSTSFTGCTRGQIVDYTPGSSTLSAGINATVTTIGVASTASFPIPDAGSYGVVRVGDEIIYYTGISGNNLTGCSRGASGTTAASHLISAAIAEYFGVIHSYLPGSLTGTPNPVYVYYVLGELGSTGWGDESTGSGVGVSQQMRIWSNDNYGQDLIFAPRGGPIYYWTDNTSTWARALSLSNLTPAANYPPLQTNQVLVSDVSRFIIAMGATPYPSGTFDPMLVRWSDQEDVRNWNEADITGQAGSQRLSNGSYIVQAKKNRQEIIIWTDSAVYSMQYLGAPYVWGFQLLMDNTSILGPSAAIVVNNVAYWMGTDKFYSYSGTVQTLPCALRQYIFDDISFEQRFQTVAGTNEGYNEVWWYYVSQSEANAAASESRAPMVDRYVIYNHLERVWYYGSLSRTYWLDTGLQQYPMAANITRTTLASAITASDTSIAVTTTSGLPNSGVLLIGSELVAYTGSTGNTLTGCTRGYANTNNVSHAAGSVVTLQNFGGTLLFHENGVDDASTATAIPFDAYISSSDFDIGDGHNFGYVWRIIPDVNFTGSTNGFPQVYMQVSPRNFSGSAYGNASITDTVSAQQYSQAVKQYIVQKYTPQVYSRIRGRQMSFRIGSGGQLGVAWQLGSPRLDVRPDGKR